MTPATRMMAPAPMRIASRRRRLPGGGGAGGANWACTSAGSLTAPPALPVCVVLPSIVVSPLPQAVTFHFPKGNLIVFADV